MTEPDMSISTGTSIQTDTHIPTDVDDIESLRRRIDQADAALIRIWQDRQEVSRRIGAARLASGGTRLALDREQAVLSRFRAALGPDGTQLALLLLRAGRGPL
jgi:chorismate mutase